MKRRVGEEEEGSKKGRMGNERNKAKEEEDRGR